MSAEIIEPNEHQPDQEVVDSIAIQRMREALEDGASYVISYAKADIERYGTYGNKPYAYFRVGKTVLRLVE